MFINISNHPSSKWDKRQREAAHRLGGPITDLPFPDIPAQLSSGDLECMAEQYYGKVLDMLRPSSDKTETIKGSVSTVHDSCHKDEPQESEAPALVRTPNPEQKSACTNISAVPPDSIEITDVVMVQGEFTFTYRLVKKLEESGIPCVAACTRRDVEEAQQENGTTIKKSIFHFVQFRRYESENAQFSPGEKCAF